jgi:hypothetical protein
MKSEQELKHVYRVCIYVDLYGKKLMKWTERKKLGEWGKTDCWASGQCEAASSAKSPLYKNGITFIQGYKKTF